MASLPPGAGQQCDRAGQAQMERKGTNHGHRARCRRRDRGLTPPRAHSPLEPQLAPHLCPMSSCPEAECCPVGRAAEARGPRGAAQAPRPGSGQSCIRGARGLWAQNQAPPGGHGTELASAEAAALAQDLRAGARRGQSGRPGACGEAEGRPRDRARGEQRPASRDWAGACREGPAGHWRCRRRPGTREAWAAGPGRAPTPPPAWRGRT